jgi:hypothetical protein
LNQRTRQRLSGGCDVSLVGTPQCSKRTYGFAS